MGITKLLEMKRDGLQPYHRIWTCFIKAASRCEQTEDAMLLANALQENGFDLPIRSLADHIGLKGFLVFNVVGGGIGISLQYLLMKHWFVDHRKKSKVGLSNCKVDVVQDLK